MLWLPQKCSISNPQHSGHVGQCCRDRELGTERQSSGKAVCSCKLGTVSRLSIAELCVRLLGQVPTSYHLPLLRPQPTCRGVCLISTPNANQVTHHPDSGSHLVSLPWGLHPHLSLYIFLMIPHNCLLSFLKAWPYLEFQFAILSLRRLCHGG